MLVFLVAPQLGCVSIGICQATSAIDCFEPRHHAGYVGPARLAVDGSASWALRLGDRARVRQRTRRSPRPARPLSLLLSRRDDLCGDHIRTRPCTDSGSLPARSQPLHAHHRLPPSWAMYWLGRRDWRLQTRESSLRSCQALPRTLRRPVATAAAQSALEGRQQRLRGDLVRPDPSPPQKESRTRRRTPGALERTVHA